MMSGTRQGVTHAFTLSVPRDAASSSLSSSSSSSPTHGIDEDEDEENEEEYRSALPFL
jgi:hypothetical protein